MNFGKHFKLLNDQYTKLKGREPDKGANPFLRTRYTSQF